MRTKPIIDIPLAKVDDIIVETIPIPKYVPKFRTKGIGRGGLRVSEPTLPTPEVPFGYPDSWSTRLPLHIFHSPKTLARIRIEESLELDRRAQALQVYRPGERQEALRAQAELRHIRLDAELRALAARP